MKARGVAYCPTLTREVSTFVYESKPGSFPDPFFLREADKGVVAQLQEPSRQAAMRASKSAQAYKAGLAVAKRNLKRAGRCRRAHRHGHGCRAGPERFQGYFEHLEMEMMAEAGLTPDQIPAFRDDRRRTRHEARRGRRAESRSLGRLRRAQSEPGAGHPEYANDLRGVDRSQPRQALIRAGQSRFPFATPAPPTVRAIYRIARAPCRPGPADARLYL